MADEKIIIQVDVDGKGAEKALGDLEKKSKSIGDGIESGFKGVFGKSAGEVAELATKFTLLAGTVGVALKVTKEIGEALFNAALEGEKIGVINNQFELLTKQAGLSADAISEGLIAAADGLADTEDILQAASGAVVAFGKNAERLPELFELSRKAAQIFGGDVVDRFEQLSQAIASGQARALKNLGIIVDANGAYQDYAKTLGLTADKLNETQKQQAFLNAVLERGKNAFSGVDVNASELGNASTRLSISISELKDTINLIAKESLGGFFRSALESSAESINSFNTEIKKAAGIGLTYEETLTDLTDKLEGLRGAIELNRRAAAAGAIVDSFSLKKEAAEIEKQIALLKEKNDAQNEASFQRALKAPAAGLGTTPEQDAQIAQAAIDNQNKIKEAFVNAEKEKLAVLQQRIQISTDDEIKAVQQIAANELQQSIVRQEFELNRQALIKSFEENQITDKAVQNELLLLQEQTFQERLRLLDEETKNFKLNNQKTFLSGFVAAQQESLKQLQGFDKIGRTVFNSYKTNAVNAFLAVGAGAMSAGEALKSITFGVIADTAQAKGAEMILAGIWPPNPPAIAGGAALIALAGSLRAKSKGGSELSGGIPSSGGGATIGGGSNFASPESAADAIQEKTTAVTIDVQGTVLNPIQVGQQIAQILNDTFDATGTRVTTGAA